MSDTFFQEPNFATASIPLDIAAKALGLDKQTIRIMLQNNIVSWGTAFKMPGSSQYTYIIYSRKFWLETGFLYMGGTDGQ